MRIKDSFIMPMYQTKKRDAENIALHTTEERKQKQKSRGKEIVLFFISTYLLSDFCPCPVCLCVCLCVSSPTHSVQISNIQFSGLCRQDYIVKLNNNSKHENFTADFCTFSLHFIDRITCKYSQLYSEISQP